MKITALLLCTILQCPFPASAQSHFQIIAEKTNAVYAGLANPLEIITCKIPCNSLWLSSRNGKIKRIQGCHFEFFPIIPQFVDPLTDESGKAVVIISRIEGNDTIRLDSSTFPIHSLPRPYVAIVGHGRNVKERMLGDRAGLKCYLEGFDYDAPFSILNYTITFLRKSGKWIEVEATGPYFTKEVKAVTETLESGDRILISNIIVDGPVEKGIKLLPLFVSIE